MKFVNSREIRVNPKPVFDAAKNGDEVVITSRGKPVALLVGVDGDNLEETLRLLGGPRPRPPSPVCATTRSMRA